MFVDVTGNVYVATDSVDLGRSNIVILKFGSDGNLQWTAQYNGIGDGLDSATCLAVDVSGNIYVTGYSTGASGYYDIVTFKYSSNGAMLWNVVYNGMFNGDDLAQGIALDGSGNVYITGSSEGADTGYDLVTIKYDGDGNLLWQARYDGPQHIDDGGKSICVDSAGNVCVTGFSRYRDSDTYANMVATIKYDSMGTLLWANRYLSFDAWDNVGTSIGIEKNGNIYVATDISIIKYGADGSLLWENFSSSPIMALSTEGDVVVAGVSAEDQTRSDFSMVKYDSSGNQLWTSTHDERSTFSNDISRFISVDAIGNIYVAGDCRLDLWNNDMVTVKYDAEGNQLWTANVTADVGGLAAMRLDSTGNIYIAGTVNHDMIVVKYDFFGNQIWKSKFGGLGRSSANDGASDLRIDKHGNVYVTGWYDIPVGNFVTIKYDASGNMVWVAQTTARSDPGLRKQSGLSLDSLDNVYVYAGASVLSIIVMVMASGLLIQV